MSAYDPSIIEKVKKLFALGARGDTHEAALALEMAQRLMAKHQLTQEQVEVGEIVEDGLRSIATVTKAKMWELRLYHGVADAFGVGLLFYKGQSFPWGGCVTATYNFIGPKTEVQLAVYVATYLQRQLVKARGAFTRSLNPAMDRKGKSREVDAYCEGWVAAVLKKVVPLVPSAAQRAAVVAAKEKRTKNGPKLELNHNAGGSIASAVAGAEDGDDVDLRKPVAGADDSRALGSGLNLPSGGER